MARPDWFNAATKNWVPQMGHDYDPWTQQAQSNVGQQWYRSPSWGGHVIWNPQFGFQDLRQVQDFYIGWNPEETPNFAKAFQNAGFNKQLSNVGDWTQFYGDPEHAHVSHQQKLAMYGGQNQSASNWGQSQQSTPDPPYGSTTQTGRGFYAPKYGSTVSQYRTGGRGGPDYGTDAGTDTSADTSGQMTSTPGHYYGTEKKKTSMRYGYKPSM